MLTKIISNGQVFEMNTAILMSYSQLARNVVKYAREDDGSMNFDHLELESWQTVFDWMNNPSFGFGRASWQEDKIRMMNLMVTSNYLLMDELSAEIETWFVSKMTTETAVEIHHFSKAHLADSLKDKCDIFLMENFTNIESEYFHLLDFEDMVQMLKSDYLTQSEEEITQFIQRVTTESNLYLHQDDNDEAVRMLESCSRDWRLPSMPRFSKELVFSFGGWTEDPVAKISVYDPAVREWRDLDVDLPFNWAYMGARLDGSFVYLCGGYSHGENDIGTISKKLFRWDLNIIQQNLTPLSKMKTKRNYVCFEGSDRGKIYAIGGNAGSNRLESVESYDIDSNQWTMLANMGSRRSDAGVAVVNNAIYIVGGFNGTSVYSSVEMLQLEVPPFSRSTRARNSSWQKVRPMSTPRSGVQAVGYNGKLYVVGGWNGTVRLSSGEVYDPRKNKWKPLPNMNLSRSNFSLVVVNGQLMAFGGFDGEAVTARAEILNWSTNAWEEVGALPTPRSALAGVTVKRSVLGKAMADKIKAKFEENIQEELGDMDIGE